MKTNDLTNILLNFDKSKKAFISLDDANRKELAQKCRELLEHRNRGFERNLSPDRIRELQIKHEFTRDDLIGLEFDFCHQDFSKNKQDRHKLKGAKFDDSHSFLNRSTTLDLTKTLQDKLHNLYGALFSSEIILRATDENTGELCNTELIHYEFSGKTYENKPDDLVNQEGILCLPNWRIFIEDSQYSKWSLIARKYTAEPDSLYSINPKFSVVDYGNIVFAKNKEHGRRMIKEHSELKENGTLFDEIKLEPPSISNRFTRRYDF